MHKNLYLIGIIIIGLLFGIFSIAAENSLCGGKYVAIELKYNNGNFSILNKDLGAGCFPRVNNPGFDYSYDLQSTNTTLYEAGFSPVLYSDNEAGGDVDISNLTSFFIFVPKERGGDNVNVYYNGTKILGTEVKNVGVKSCRI